MGNHRIILVIFLCALFNLPTANLTPPTPPDGYRSVEHFLDDLNELTGRMAGGVMSLARYLNVNEKSVRRWLSRKQLPLQSTIDAMARWRTGRR